MVAFAIAIIMIDIAVNLWLAIKQVVDLPKYLGEGW